MWSLFSSGSKTPKKEVIDKEEYNQVISENENFNDKVSLLRNGYNDNKAKLEVVQKKIEGLEVLVAAKQELIKLLKSGPNSIISSDLKGVDRLKQELKDRIQKLTEENKVGKQELEETYIKLHNEIEENGYGETKKIVMQMGRVSITNPANFIEEEKEIAPPSLTQIKEKIKNMDNSEDIYELIKKIPNKLEEYENSNVRFKLNQQEDVQENVDNNSKGGWEPEPEIT